MFLLFQLICLVTADSTVSIPNNLKFHNLATDSYGYSIEANGIQNFTYTNLTKGIFSVIKGITGISPPLRMGGISNDRLIVNSDQDTSETGVGSDISVRKDWFNSWTDYWPNDTRIIFTTNFQDSTNDWGNGTQLAEWALEVLGDRLEAFELGNEVDHYSWDGDATEQYVGEYFQFYNKLKNQSWWEDTSIHAAVFADPPGFPDQEFYPGMDIKQAIADGLVDSDISAYVVHLYPQSTCDAARSSYLTLPVLSNHAVVWSNISQYIPEEAATSQLDLPLVLGETNSASCGGRSGISDTFGAALWGVDYFLTATTIGISQVYWHLGPSSEYSAFVPSGFEYNSHYLRQGIRANFYSHLFLAHVVSGSNGFQVAALPDANYSDFSGFGVFTSNSSDTLNKLVFVDLGIWNTSGSYVSNPTTDPDYDSTCSSSGSRPIRDVQVNTPWKENSTIEIIRLLGEGTNAKSGVNVSGTTVSDFDGSLQGALERDNLTVGANGAIHFTLHQAEGVLLQSAVNSSTSVPSASSSVVSSLSATSSRVSSISKSSGSNDAARIGTFGWTLVLVAAASIVLF